jgi:hypothetical protein
MFWAIQRRLFVNTKRSGALADRAESAIFPSVFGTCTTHEIPARKKSKRMIFGRMRHTRFSEPTTSKE